ncbi:MAG TPA: lipid A deacylase LpxR family protein [Chthoniobacterales bacterium]|nr:lipid A deacylase LpxR family protein [Chthoniobacterales bacterium]
MAIRLFPVLIIFSVISAGPGLGDQLGRLNVIEENDVVFGTDKHYTQGLKISYITPQLGDQSFFNAPIKVLRNYLFLFATPESDLDDRLEWTLLGQSLFTPSNLHLDNPDPRDRPYAGWLYGGVDFIQNAADRRLDSLELQFGVVGSAALGRQTQNDFHVFSGGRKAKGWGYQLANEFGFNASWERKWRFGCELPAEFGFEFIPDAGVTAGNVLTYGELGGLFRIGRGLKANWGPELIRPGYSGTGYFEAARAKKVGLGFSFFAGAQGRAIGRNIFLDGNSFATSRSVPKNYLVADLIFGVELFYSNCFRVAATGVIRSSEFHNQGVWDKFGSINCSFEF